MLEADYQLIEVLKGIGPERAVDMDDCCATDITGGGCTLMAAGANYSSIAANKHHLCREVSSLQSSFRNSSPRLINGMQQQDSRMLLARKELRCSKAVHSGAFWDAQTSRPV